MLSMKKHLPELRSSWSGTAPSDIVLARHNMNARFAVMPTGASAANAPIFHTPKTSKKSMLAVAVQDITAPAPKAVAAPKPNYYFKPASVMGMGGRDAVFRDAADSVCRQGRYGLDQIRAVYQSWGYDKSHLPKTAFLPVMPMAGNAPIYAPSPRKIEGRVKVGEPQSMVSEIFGAAMSPFKAPSTLKNTGLHIKPPQFAVRTQKPYATPSFFGMKMAA